MSRILLVDSRCPRCSRAGRRLAEASSGEIELGSLHDPEMRELLDRERPGWRLRPMLLSQDGGRVRLRSGLAMGVALARSIGVRETLDVLRSLSVERARSEPSAGVSRRTMLVRSGAALTGLLLGSRAGLAAASQNTAPSAMRVTDVAVLQRLQANRDVANAARSFGPVNWADVLEVPAGDGRAACSSVLATYVLAHTDAPGTFTALAANEATALSYRISASGAERSIEWMSTSADPWAKSVMGANGRVATTAAQTDESTPDVSKAFIYCFTACIGACVSTGCAESCFFCATTLGFASCAKCAACAGPSAIACADLCA